MVVDEHMEEERWDRRFLAYDMVMCNGHSLVDRPWMVGWAGQGRRGRAGEGDSQRWRCAACRAVQWKFDPRES